LNSSLQRDWVVDGGVQIQGQGGGHPGQIRRTEQKPGPKIHGKVGPVGGTAGKHIHAIVQHPGNVRAHVGIPVQVEHGPQRHGKGAVRGVVAGKVGTHVAPQPKPQQVKGRTVRSKLRRS
jgi:hypothetical protein